MSTNNLVRASPNTRLSYTGAVARVGILTGGGDCPGLNAVIRATTRRSIDRGWEVAAVQEGWRGLIDGTVEPLGRREVSGILPRGGTILGTSRTNPYKIDGGVDELLATFEREGLDALVAVGGEDTLGVAAKLHAEYDFPVVGVPKTIDNDLNATDYTVGFDTAVTIATEAIDRLHTTAESHNRVMVIEVMGRHTGWIAVHSGIAGGADVILIPEQPMTVEDACSLLEKRHKSGKDFSIVVVSEGYELTYASGEKTLVAGEARPTDQFGHVVLGGVGGELAREIEHRTGFETRVTVLGHVQRGGTPTPRDRVLATRYGLKAADLVEEGRFGRMASLQGDAIVDVSLEEATRELKTVPPEWYAVAQAFAGYSDPWPAAPPGRPKQLRRQFGLRCSLASRGAPPGGPYLRTVPPAYAPRATRQEPLAGSRRPSWDKGFGPRSAPSGVFAR